MTKLIENRIIDYLVTLPELESEDSRRALLFNAVGNDPIRHRIRFSGATADFTSLLVQTLSKHGTLDDGRNALDSLLRVTEAAVGQEKREQLHDLLNAWQRQIGDVTNENVQSSPFMGLRPFDERDAKLFFGREKLTKELMQHLKDERFLAVVGASGSGKSSVMRAGLLPSLRQGTKQFQQMTDWSIFPFTPTADPIKGLATSLTQDSESVTAAATLIDDLMQDPRSLDLYVNKRFTGQQNSTNRLLIVVDQFEEIFTLCKDEQKRTQFIQNLLHATMADGPTSAIISLRADFYANCAEYDDLRQALEEKQRFIGPMSADELRTAIEEPANQSGYAYEEGLVDEILQDIGAGENRQPEPGALPLLSHTLLEVWKRRSGRHLTFSGYNAAGGVQGAIAQSAEQLFQEGLTKEQQEIAKNIFLRLTSLGDSGPDTRQRVSLSQLTPQGQDSAAIQTVLHRLANSHLVTIHRGDAEVAHEALIREWPTLRTWLVEDREGQRIRQHITEAASEWNNHKQDPSLLYGRLFYERAHDYAKKTPDALNELEQSFLNASQDKLETQEREKEEAYQLQIAQQAKLNRWQRWLIYAVTSALLLTIGGAAIINNLVRTAEALRSATEFLKITGDVAKAQAIREDKQLPLSMHIAITAQQRYQGAGFSGIFPGIEELLRHGLSVLPMPLTYRQHKAMVMTAAFSPNGEWVASGDENGAVQIWRPATGASTHTLTHSERIQNLAFGTDNRYLVSSDVNKDGPIGNKPIKVIDLKSGKQRELSSSGSIQEVSLSLDGRWIAVASNYSVVVHDSINLEETINVTHDKPVASVKFSNDSQRFVTASQDGTAKIWEIDAQQKTHQKIGIFEHHAELSLALFDDDGDRVAAIGGDGSVLVYDIATSKVMTIPHSSNVSDIAISPDGNLLATASDDNSARIWSLKPVGELARLTHQDLVQKVAFSPNSQQIVTASEDSTARVWDVASGVEIARLIHEKDLRDAQFDASGKRIVTASNDGTARTWQIHNVDYVPIHQERIIWEADFSGDGARVVIGAEDQSAAWIWDASSGEEIARTAPLDSTVRSVAYNHDGSELAIGTEAGQIYLWNIGSTEKKYNSHQSAVMSLAFAPKTQCLTSGSTDKQVNTWPRNECTHDFKTHEEFVLDISYSHNGKYLATAGQGGMVKIFEVDSRKDVAGLPLNGMDVNAISFHPDRDHYLAMASADGLAQIWDWEKEEVVGRFAHGGQVRDVEFHPNGKFLATASEDQTARIWELDTGEELTRLQHSSRVEVVTFDPAGTHLLTASGNSARIYHFDELDLIQSKDLVDEVCKRLTRNLTESEWQQYFGDDEYRVTCPNLSAPHIRN
ncbi:MAG: hypothetical protein AAF702_00845 [Chloroflexota bacterium]